MYSLKKQYRKDFIFYLMNLWFSWIAIFTGVHSASAHSQMGFSMNLKDINIVNMIFMFCLPHAVANVVS